MKLIEDLARAAGAAIGLSLIHICFDSVIDFSRYTQEDLAEIAEILLNEFLNKFKCTSRNVRLFRKIVGLMNPIPYPGELKNIIRSSVAFSNPTVELDYLKRLYKTCLLYTSKPSCTAPIISSGP